MRPTNKLSWHNFQECFSMSSFSPQNEKGLSLRLGSLYPLSTFFKLYKEITLRDFIMGYTLWRLRKRLWKFTKYHMNIIWRSLYFLNRNLITYILLNSFWIFLVLFKFYKCKPYSCKDVIIAWLELLLSTPFSCFNIFMFLM